MGWTIGILLIGLGALLYVLYDGGYLPVKSMSAIHFTGNMGAATKEQTQTLVAHQAEFGLEPMEDTFAFVKQLQAEFDLSKIPYTEDYYDIDMNPTSPSMRFEHVDEDEWRIVFLEKMHPDIIVTVI